VRHAEAFAELAAAAPKVPAELPEAAQRYVEKVRRAAYTVADADVESLRAAGLDDERIFELALAAALEAGLERLDAGLRALAEAS
jgi:alkylhydroperoxidase family enzyme